MDKCASGNIPQRQMGCAEDTVNVWINVRLRVCVFYTETREIKASICPDLRLVSRPMVLTDTHVNELL